MLLITAFFQQHVFNWLRNLREKLLIYQQLIAFYNKAVSFERQEKILNEKLLKHYFWALHFTIAAFLRVFPIFRSNMLAYILPRSFENHLLIQKIILTVKDSNFNRYFFKFLTVIFSNFGRYSWLKTYYRPPIRSIVWHSSKKLITRQTLINKLAEEASAIYHN